MLWAPRHWTTGNGTRQSGPGPARRYLLFRLTAWLTLAAVMGTPGAMAAGPLDAPSPEVVAEARELVAAMIRNQRGPYQRIRWYCKDGTVQPPVAYACRDHGGGRQHAEFSDARQRLAALGWHVGTIFAALDPQDLAETGSRNLRLRQLPLERYLTDVDDGWVLRRALSYRGRVQAENEEAAGRSLLLGLLEDSSWIANNFLLVRELVRVIPHGTAPDATRLARRQATAIAAQLPSFQPLRLEIHGSPGAQTAARVRAWALAAQLDDSTRAQADEIIAALERVYGGAGRSQRLAAAQQLVQRTPALDGLNLQPAAAAQTDERRQQLSLLAQELRNRIQAPLTARQRLLLLDALPDLETELRLEVEPLLATPGSRRDAARLATQLVHAGYGSGLLSQGETKTLITALAPLADSNGPEEVPLQHWLDVVRTLALAPGWALGTLRHTFAEALQSYTALTPKAALFSDDLLRASPLLALAQIAEHLGRDSQHLAGVRGEVFGEPAADVSGVNPGLALGRLRVLRPEQLSEPLQVQRGDIVVLPETVPELPPVAGVLTLGENNLLSHIQLLARNFGIPNVAIGAATLARLQPMDGQRVALLVATDGSVVLQHEEQLNRRVLAALSPSNNQVTEKLQVPKPDLEMTTAIPLAGLRRSLSGRVVGPKAANLGELNALFPGQVAQAVALPFGQFLQGISAGDPSPRQRLVQAYQAHRNGDLPDAELQAELQDIRRSIEALALNPQMQQELLAICQQLFGPAGSYGVFVRSDTNVEDLPGFTGAGLSKTLANVVGEEALLRAIPEVWASVLSPRAIAWRSNLLEHPEEVYSSVLVMLSVPSDKSGVLVTTDLSGRRDGLTVSTAWGVGGAVGGESAETLVLLPNGSRRLLSEAKAPYRRALASSGGMTWDAAAQGPVLTPEEQQLLRNLALDVAARYEPVIGADGKQLPWDIEFGFVAGKLTLFQIRPLVERGQQKADRLLQHVLEPGPEPVPEPGPEPGPDQPATAVTLASGLVDLLAPLHGRAP